MSKYTDAVERGLEGTRFVSFGPICEAGHCAECDDAGFSEPYQDGYTYGEYIGDEGVFSWRSCGICGSTLGGNRYVWHWVDDENEMHHEHDGCTDCLMYIENGDEPEGCDNE